MSRPLFDSAERGTPLELSAELARRFLVRRHLLAPPRSLPAGPDGVMAAVALLGSLQFDPLSVAGRNHDLVLHARVRDYEPTWTERLLYERRELFETVNKMLSLLPISELPWYGHHWDTAAARHERDGTFERHQETARHVLELITQRGPMSSLDFDRRRAVEWYWGPTNEVRAVLEALFEAGRLALARREGNRRYYDLAERVYPRHLLEQRPPPREQMRHKLLSRYRGVGLLGTGGDSTLWYGTGKARRSPDDPPDAVIRSELRDELVASGHLVPVQVEGVRGTRFVLGDERGILEQVRRESEGEDPGAGGGPGSGGHAGRPSATFLAPLDPLVWDRELLRQLFGFDYVWEVYVPEARRRWGYYVLPILFGDRLVGRIEPRIERSQGEVRILGLWWEEGIDPRREEGLVEAMREALAAYLRFARVARLSWPAGLAKERRLIGTRPA